MEKLTGVILMAGLSTRFGGPKNKQLCLLNNKPVFSYSIDAFSSSKAVDKLIVVVNRANKDDIGRYIKEKGIKASLILGGKTRQESVENALASLKCDKDDVVLIHDGARPLVDDYIIKDVGKAAHKYGAATAYLEAIDTIAVKSNKDEIKEFIERTSIAQIQTPQGFKFGLLKEAHKRASNKKATDDCSLIMALNKPVKLVKGDKKYHKITTKEDILYLEGLLK